MVGSRIKISRPRHRKRQNYYSINPYTRDLARTSCGLSRRSPRKLQQREKREPCRSLPRTLFFFSGTAPWHRAHAPWDLVAILLSRVRSPLDIPRTLYISPISPLHSSPLLLLLRLPSSFSSFSSLSQLGLARRATRAVEEVGSKSYGIFLSTRRNLPGARSRLVIPKQTIASLSPIFLASTLFRPPSTSH